MLVKLAPYHSGVVCLSLQSLLSLCVPGPVYRINKGVAILEKVFKEDLSEEVIIEYIFERVGEVSYVGRTFQREEP